MSIYKLFQLIRLPNLLILGLLQLLLRFALASPVMMLEGRPLLLSTEEFLLLVISCMLIAAGGYIINDIEDESIDRINRPDSVVIGKYISSGQAYWLYFAFTLGGILIGFYLSYFARIQYIGTINAVTAGLLYFYATSYKCIPLLGNLIIALLTAMAVFIVAFPEPLILNNTDLFSFFTGFAMFAFLYTLIREMIKDLEDHEGDQASGCRTVVGAFGEKAVRRIAAMLLTATIAFLLFIQFATRQWEAPLPFFYLLITVVLPSLYLLVKILKSDTKSDYRNCSNLSKIIMLAGILSILIFYFSIEL